MTFDLQQVKGHIGSNWGSCLASGITEIGQSYCNDKVNVDRYLYTKYRSGQSADFPAQTLDPSFT